MPSTGMVWLRTRTGCPVIVGNQLTFRDGNHITPECATLLGPVMSALATRVLPTG